MRRKHLTWPLFGLLTIAISLSAGCDPQLQLAVQNGIINTSTSFLGALARAALNVALDPNAGL